jgi:septal ring factor EnvC (AmiA/AmiB activator)
MKNLNLNGLKLLPIGKKQNNMKEFFTKNFRDIILILLGCLLVFLLVRTFTPVPDKSELLKYKIEELNKKILEAQKRQKQLDDSIALYKKDIQRIDENIQNIRSQKTVINNYYEQKKKEIPGMTNKQIDSTLRKRYNY